MNGTCDWKNCRLPAAYGYSPRERMRSVEMCQKHWTSFCCKDGEAMQRRRLRKLGYREHELACLLSRPLESDSGMEKGELTMTKKVKSTKSTKKVTPRSGHGPGKLIGKTEGRSARAHWVHLLERNAKATKSKRLTDEQILAAMNKEFPGRTSAQFTNVAGVAVARAWYNRGGMGYVPKTPSVAYDSSGEVCPTKRSRKSSKNSQSKEVKSAGKKKVKKGAKIRRRK